MSQDSTNQSNPLAAATVAPTAPPTTSQANQPAPAASTAEIDDLLHKLDELSKEIEQKEVAGELNKASETAADKPAQPVSQAPTPTPTSTPTSSSAPAPSASKDDFDMDKFLADLEQKINITGQAGSQAEKPAQDGSTESPPTSTQSDSEVTAGETANFRKQRASLNLDELQEQQPALPSAQPAPALSATPAVASLEEPEATPALPVKDNDFSNLLTDPGKPAADASTALPEQKSALPNVSEASLLTAAAQAKSADPGAEDLASQNIFELLHIDAPEEEKERFLQEIEELIFEDFLTKDVPLLLTSQELTALQQIQADTQLEDAPKKEKILEYLFSTLPNLETLLYDKALQLKEEMVLEKVKRLESNPANSDKIKEVRSAIAQNHWRQAGTVLNSLTT